MPIFNSDNNGAANETVATMAFVKLIDKICEVLQVIIDQAKTA